MSTRCNIHFTYGQTVVANIYRHCDGYPNGYHGVRASLGRFFADVEAQTKDTRFGDPEYLAAKYLVWQALQNGDGPEKPMDFTGLGVSLNDHGDIEFVYTVDCSTLDSKARPTVTSKPVRG